MWKRKDLALQLRLEEPLDLNIYIATGDISNQMTGLSNYRNKRFLFLI